jgi:hypothetical protein
MSDDPGQDRFEEMLRAFAREVSESVERAAEQFDLEELADRIGMSGEKVKDFVDLAGQWLGSQFQAPDDNAPTPAQPARAHAAREQTGGQQPHQGPHPLDLPTEEQGLALSALESGRWKVKPGTNELIFDGEGPGPREPVGLVGELRARDWIAASGEVTLVGRDALKRWMDSAARG